MSGCDICAKHRGEGPLGGQLVARTDGFWVYHAPPGEDGLAPLGYLFVETDRHVPYVADLTEEEAATLGRLRTLLARGLREEAGAAFTFAMVVGAGVAHVHEHLMARFPDAPDTVPWYRSHQASPRADPAEVRDLTDQLARRLLHLDG